ncbi:hypothetical protein PHMEG_00026863 [Phytophthora megakarya]|uniref:Uncharacterized protein n=1 Tax=Phytophthora megakarya TaxID=4795 RepID=A0A225V9R2_9STRA|nr:hypothetical protein PHMEG_00026863 [Phytophthora megakarya]
MKTANPKKLPLNAGCLLEPEFKQPGAQEAWCQILNWSLSKAIAKKDKCIMSATILMISFDTESPSRPYYQIRCPFPTEPCVYVLGEYTAGVKISIRATGHGAAVRLWRQFSGNGSGPTEKTILGLALWERRHWI